MTQMMKAAWRDRYGPPEVVQVREVEQPIPKRDEVLVRVRAASINRGDLDFLRARWKFLRLFYGLRRPRNRRLGIDVAGVVESVGSDVTRFGRGDRVFGDLFPYGQDAFSEYVTGPEKAFAKMGEDMSFEGASTFPQAAVLALQGLRMRNGRTFGPGAKVMVVGASGSVGPFAVQIAKSRGAHVTGVASTEKLDFVRSLGADEVLDYTNVDYTATGRQFDWIVDVNAHQPVTRWRNALRPNGVYAALGGDSAGWFAKVLIQGPLVSLASRKRMGLMLHWKPFAAEDVETLKTLFAAGKVKPVIDRQFPLSEIVEALRYVDEGRARGKVVITP